MIDRIKEPTFNDLIDAAAQAFKDGKLAKVTMMRDGLIYLTTHDIRVKSVSDDIPSSGIDFIKSLYTETFVIESEGDIERVKVGALIELSNGNSDRAMLTDKYSGQSMVQFSENKHWGAVGLFILKGATVTQEVSK